MASSPFYGDRPPLQGSFRRSFTTPHRRLSHHERAGLDPSDADANILYSHPAARVVKFTPSTASIPPSNSLKLPDTDYPVDTVETLPWAATTETTLATGPLIIEKVQGSTNFLKCGDVMHAILRNSQCWCVDGVSKFVLRVRQFQYYRIELPASNTQETEKVEELKNVLKKILRFEITPCPFKRGFHVDLPDSALTPRRKGKWKKREGSLPSTLSEGQRSTSSRSTRAWSRRATTDGRLGVQMSGHSGDASQNDSPLSKRLLGDVGRLEEARSTTPSSLASNEEQAEWDDQDAGSDETVSDQDESPSESLDPTPSKIGTVPEAFDESSDHDLTDEEQSVVEQPNLDKPNTVDYEVKSFHNDTPKEISHGEAEGDHDAKMEQGEEPAPEPVEILSLLPESHTLEGEHPSTDQISAISEVSNREDESETLMGSAEKLEPNNSLTTLADKDAASHEQDQVKTEASSAPGSPIEEYTPKHTEQDELIKDVIEDHPKEDELGHEPETHDDVERQNEVEIDEDAEIVKPSLDEEQDETLSKVSSIDSFHTFTSSEEKLPASVARDVFDGDVTPMAERYDPMSFPGKQHKRESSELTAAASSTKSADAEFLDLESPESERPSTPPLTHSSASENSWADIGTPSSPSIQQGLRHRLTTRRSLSPLPPSSTIFSPQQQQAQSNHITVALLQKAYSVALIKPIEVVVLLVHVIARIASGATVNDLLSGDLFKRPEQGRDHRRNASLPDQIDSRRDDGTDEDDYGVPIRGRARSTDVGKQNDDADSLSDLD